MSLLPRILIIILVVFLSNLDVGVANAAPTAVGETVFTGVNTPTTINVLANDSPSPGASLVTGTVNVKRPYRRGISALRSGQISFTPITDFIGDETFNYTVQDTTGLISNIATVTVKVNGAPTDISLLGLSVPENQPAATNVGTFSSTDPNAGDTHTYTLVAGAGSTDNASFQISGSSLQTANALDFETKSSYSVRVRSTDAGGLFFEKAFTITVTDLNEAPTFTVGPNQTVNEDAGAQTVNSWATGISDGDTGNAQTLTFSVTNNTNAALFASAPIISPAGVLTYTPADNANGVATISVQLTDNGSNVAPNANQSVVQDFTITVNSLNDAPSFTKGADQTVLEDAGAQTVAGWATAIDDGDADVVQTLAFDIINNSNPSLFSAEPAINPTNGNLTYTLNANANGSATITIVLSDNGSNAVPNFNTSASQEFTINVTPVNDSPAFTLPVTTNTVLEDAGAVSVANFATGVDDGDPELSQTLTFVLTDNTNPGLFSAGPAMAADGTLTYTPAANANGSANISVQLSDGGGASNGGVEITFPKRTITLNVTAVDDPPVAVADSATVTEDSGANAINVLVNDTDIDAGPKTVNSVTQPANGTVVITGGGTGLTYQPNPNYCNSLTSTQDTFNYTLNGGSSATVSVSVTCTNDVPVAQNKPTSGTIGIQANMKRVGIDAGLLTGISDADSGIDGCSPTFSVASLSVAGGSVGTVSNLNASTGTFDFEPGAGSTATVTLNYTVQDNGCPAPAQTSVAKTVTLTINGPMIWFVNPQAATNGSGTLFSPFNVLSSADAVDAANHRIFVYSGTVSTGLALNSDEWLIGQGASGSFDTLLGITPPSGTIARPTLAGTRPTLQNTVTLATNAKAQGFNLLTGANTGITDPAGATAGVSVNEVDVTASTTAVSFNDLAGAVTLGNTTSTGGANNVSLTNVSATVDLGGGALSGSIAGVASHAFLVSGGTGNVTYTGGITKSNQGNVVNISGRTGGTITLGGSINGNSSNGVNVSSNTGGTINFSGNSKTLNTGANAAVTLATNTGTTVNFSGGGLVITTTSAIGFNATGGATAINVTGTGNILTSTTGTALNVASTTIGASGLTFQSISSNAATNGILLNNTGTTNGGLTVSGTGTAGSGGTIQNSTGTGILLTSTRNVVLNRMNITGSADDGSAVLTSTVLCWIVAVSLAMATLHEQPILGWIWLI